MKHPETKPNETFEDLLSGRRAEELAVLFNRSFSTIRAYLDGRPPFDSYAKEFAPKLGLPEPRVLAAIQRSRKNREKADAEKTTTRIVARR